MMLVGLARATTVPEAVNIGLLFFERKKGNAGDVST